MRFSLKFALSAVLANTIAAELAHTPQAQQLQNELDAKYVLQPQPLQQQDLQPTFRQAEQAEVNENNGYEAVRMPYALYSSPDSQYQFVPMSMPVQNAKNEAINGQSSDFIASYAEPAGQLLYPVAEQSRIAPYANSNIGGGYNPGAFAVQSGYEGFLVPEPPKAVAEKAVQAKSNNELPFIGSITSALSSLTSGLPAPFRSFATQAFAVLSALLGATVVGGGLTTAICTFTPLCTISFALPFTRSSFRSLASPFLGAKNAEIIDESYALVQRALDKKGNELAAKVTAADATATKSVDGKDITPDVAQTIKKVNSVMETAAKEADPALQAVLAEPASKTIINDKSNDK